MMSAAADSQPWIDYDYAVVRLVPNVHLGAYLNIGVVIHARTAKYLDARVGIRPELVAAFAPAIDAALLQRYMDAYRCVCLGGDAAGPIGLLPASERFHWLTAPRSAVIQTSPVHPGRCRDLPTELDTLFAENCAPALPL